LPLYAQYCSSLSSLTQRSINEGGRFLSVALRAGV
jgi:hypothetical protein